MRYYIVLEDSRCHPSPTRPRPLSVEEVHGAVLHHDHQFLKLTPTLEHAGCWSSRVAWKREPRGVAPDGRLEARPSAVTVTR